MLTPESSTALNHFLNLRMPTLMDGFFRWITAHL